MTQHTPGKWAEAGMLILDDDGNMLAEVFYDGPDGHGEANARLIAAAPELLAALKQIAERPYAEPEDADNLHNEVNDIIRMARAIIARAKGEKRNAEGEDRWQTTLHDK